MADYQLTNPGIDENRPEATNHQEPLSINEFYSTFTAYPFKENATFKSRDPSLQNIWNVGSRTARLCPFETYMNCPYYKQLQYVGDTRIQAFVSLYVSGDDRLTRNPINQYSNSFIPEGLTDCHAWSASPNYDFLATVAGIEPASPGFKTIKISPHLGSLQWVEGKMPHPAGEIVFDFKRTGNSGIAADITLPKGIPETSYGTAGKYF